MTKTMHGLNGKKSLGAIREVKGEFLIAGRKASISLADVIKVVTKHESMGNEDILGLLRSPGLKPKDIEQVRIFIHRYGIDLKKPAKQPENPCFLLDECLPVLAVLPLSRRFGWASHVEVEGLAGKRTPDTRIWDFAAAAGFEFLVTRDNDFYNIMKYQAKEADGNAPFVIHVNQSVTVDSFIKLMGEHHNEILGIMNNGGVRGVRIAAGQPTHPII